MVTATLDAMGKDARSLPPFAWEDSLLLEEQLMDGERLIRDTARR